MLLKTSQGRAIVNFDRDFIPCWRCCVNETSSACGRGNCRKVSVCLAKIRDILPNVTDIYWSPRQVVQVEQSIRCVCLCVSRQKHAGSSWTYLGQVRGQSSWSRGEQMFFFRYRCTLWQDIFSAVTSSAGIVFSFCIQCIYKTGARFSKFPKIIQRFA